MCAMIYSVDLDTCECVPIYGMECHPQYGLNCNQNEYDEMMDRQWLNPYYMDDWYPGTIEEPVDEWDVEVEDAWENIAMGAVGQAISMTIAVTACSMALI